MIPKPARDAKVYVWELMMDEMMGPQFSITSILEMEMMMNVMEQAVTNEPGRQARHETQNKVKL